MHRLIGALALLATSLTLHATDVVDDFEAGTNPNQWGWTNNSGGAFVIEPDGGNPGAWLDSGAPYFSDHPNLTSLPPAGTPLRAALDSGTLQSASVDLERLDASSVTGCLPTYTLPSTFSLSLIDIHTDASVIEAHTIDGPPAPTDAPFDWLTAAFTIPSEATDVPPGWVLNAPPELGYTWQDLMHNVDGIRFFVLDPEEITFDACWRLGADNVRVSYAGEDKVFVDGFDGAPR
ncbi:MAG TPA: hypothetical protein VFS55_15170 [Dokdonella sp.]|nr:hypothetical protein [Dokdonella sp.]